MDRNLFIFTSSYPFGNTDTPYLTCELESLEDYFSKITLIPLSADLNKPLATNKYCIDTTLATYPRNTPHLSYLTNHHFLHEAFSSILHRRLDQLKKLWWTLIIAGTVADWAVKKIDSNSSSLLYTYWFSSVTVGLALARRRRLNLPIVTRAHGGDLYNERTYGKYFPLRTYALKKISRVFTISQNGFDYLSKQYPKYTNKFEISCLGITGSDYLTPPSQKPKTISIVSCSYIRPVKRVGFLCEILSAIGCSNPELKINWNHFGGGEPSEMENITKKIDTFPQNINVTLWGNVPNENILEFYKTNCVDFFISVSSSEGIPVSMMEALSFGIPIISTNVGGVPELVNQENGLLLDKEITIEEGSTAIMTFIKNDCHLLNRTAAKQTWRDKFNAKKNYSEFGSSLVELSESNHDTSVD